MNGENKKFRVSLMDIQASKYSGTSGQRRFQRVICKETVCGLPKCGKL